MVGFAPGRPLSGLGGPRAGRLAPSPPQWSGLPIVVFVGGNPMTENERAAAHVR
jgi:hypothetical protein